MNDHTKIATRMLDTATAIARASDRGIGVTERTVLGYGNAIVMYSRVTRTYDVGTAARSFATGRRSEVLPVLVALLGREETTHEENRGDVEWTPGGEPPCKCGACLVCEVEAIGGRVAA